MLQQQLLLIWRKELSILTESYTGCDNIKLNTKRKNHFQKYNVTNMRDIAQLTGKLKQKVQAIAQRSR
jgi:hypothetical protein